MFLVILAVIALFFQGVVEFSIVVTAMVVTAFWYEMRHVLVMGFLLGLMVDATGMRAWGLTSIFLMTVGFIIFALRVHLEWQQVLFVMSVAILFEVGWQLWWGDRVFWYELVEQALAVWTIWFVRRLTARREAVYLRN